MVPPMTAAEIDSTFAYLFSPGFGSISGFSIGILSGSVLASRFRNKFVGTTFGTLTTLALTAVGLEVNFDSNLRRSVQSGEFEKSYPNGYWKEMMRFAATGQRPNQRIIEQYSVINTLDRK